MSNNNKKSNAEELEQLRSNNFRLNSLVQELRLEIAYYQGETKRLEWEKNVLKQDVNRMSSLFKGWISELQQNTSNNRNIIEDPEYLKALVKYPAKSIADMMQLSDDLLVISTCQAPFSSR
jgi:peptidoglycan hydrolase CwlO-like protein